ncbi:hypothetical protein [Streptomyces sp. NPDC058382]
MTHSGRDVQMGIDRFDARGAMSTLFTESNEDGTYKRYEAVPFGKPLTLPASFDVAPATDAFPVRGGTHGSGGT